MCLCLSACRPVFLLRSHTPASAFSTVALTPPRPAPTPSRSPPPTTTVPRPACRGQWWCSLLAAQGSRRAATGRAVRGGGRGLLRRYHRRGPVLFTPLAPPFLHTAAPLTPFLALPPCSDHLQLLLALLHGGEVRPRHCTGTKDRAHTDAGARIKPTGVDMA